MSGIIISVAVVNLYLISHCDSCEQCHFLWYSRDDLLTIINSGHAMRLKTHSALNTRGPELSKKLGQLVKMEKNVMRSMELVGRERMEVAVSDSVHYIQVHQVNIA